MFLGKSQNIESIYNDLCSEVRTAAPWSQLSASLRSRLERCDPKQRREICSRAKDGTTPLFSACKKGNAEIVDYLLSECQVDVEQRGMFEVPEDRSVHTVTPLWCAAVAGKAQVVEVLVRHGADINSVSDTGSTPVRSACFMTHLEIVKILVANKADIQRPNYNGGTCLINSVQSGELCEFLLLNGAKVNVQDIQYKTALHYAIQEHRFETTKLLLSHKADPYLQSRYKDDALQTACLKGASEIFEYLVDNVRYSPERVASAFELIGSTFLDEHHDLQKALQYWRGATDLRSKFGIEKEILPPKEQYHFAVEFRNKTELEAFALDLDALRTQSLLICERVLGTQHKDMIYRLMYRGASYADSLQYQHCIDLWKYALELRIAKDTILYCDTCFTGQALVKLFLDLYEKRIQGALIAPIRLEDVLHIIQLLVRDLPESSNLLQVTPQSQRQQDSYDRVLSILTHLIHLVANMKPHNGNLHCQRLIHQIVQHIDPRTSSGDSLLHLSLMKTNTLKNQNLFEESHFDLFPSHDVAKLLIECGAKINAMNNEANTPLHTACRSSNFIHEVVEMLLINGAHIDSRNSQFERPIDLLKNLPDCKINPLQYLTLKCLAAKVVAENQLEYKNEVPQMLEEFIEIH